MLTGDGPTLQYYSSRGVPQVGVLSPTLFNLALIGLLEDLSSTVQLAIYVDGICVWTLEVTSLQLRALLQKVASSTLRYLPKQGMEVTWEKCTVVAYTWKPMSAYAISINRQ